MELLFAGIRFLLGCFSCWRGLCERSRLEKHSCDSYIEAWWKKGHVTLVMYESILMRVSMIFNEFFSSNCYPGQIIPWGEINIKSNSITLYPLLDLCSQCEKTHQVLEIYKRHVASGGMDATVAWWETGGWQQRWGCWALWCNQWWPSWGAWMSRWKLVNGL